MAMQLQRLTARISGGRWERRGPVGDVGSTVATVAYDSVDDDGDRSLFDRAAPSRGRTLRCDAASGGRRWHLLPRSQSVSRIDCLPSNGVGINAFTPSSDRDDATQAAAASRFRKRLDLLRGNLVARVARKRSDGGRTNDDSQRREASAVHQPEVPTAGRSKTVWYGDEAASADAPVSASSTSSSSSPTRTVFDRRRVHRRTPRRHRTVVDGEQVETARGLLRHGALRETMCQKEADNVVRHQSSGVADTDNACQKYVTNDVSSDVTSTFNDAAWHHDNDIHQLPYTRQVCQYFYEPQSIFK